MSTQYGGTQQMGLDPVTKFIIKLVISYISYQQQRKAQKRAERQARASRSNILINKQSNNDPIYTLYGKQRIGGTRALIETTNGSGDTSATTHLCMALVLCEGEMADIKELFFNDTLVWDSAGAGTKTANSSGGYTLGGFISKYASTGMTWNWYPGTSTQTVDTDLQTAVGSSIWTANHRLQGLSYLTMVLPANGDAYGGQLPTFTVVLQGHKVLDVSTLVNGATASNPQGAAYTSGADQSPADVLYDYLISREYGKGLDRDKNELWTAGLHIDLASFQQAKIDCAAARSGAGYKINGFLQTERQLFDNVGEILETCNGILLFKDGKYELHIRKQNEQLSLPTSRVFSKDNILGEIALGLPQKSRKLNKATGIFNNPVTKYNDDLVVFKSDAFITEDNGSVLETQEDYTMITDSAQVLDLITQQVNISRAEDTVTFTAAHTALLLKSGDIIEIRHDDFGWGTGAGQTQTYWRVQELKLTEDNTVEISATTYNSALEL